MIARLSASCRRCFSSIGTVNLSILYIERIRLRYISTLVRAFDSLRVQYLTVLLSDPSVRKPGSSRYRDFCIHLMGLILPCRAYSISCAYWRKIVQSVGLLLFQARRLATIASRQVTEVLRVVALSSQSLLVPNKLLRDPDRPRSSAQPATSERQDYDSLYSSGTEILYSKSTIGYLLRRCSLSNRVCEKPAISFSPTLEVRSWWMSFSYLLGFIRSLILGGRLYSVVSRVSVYPEVLENQLLYIRLAQSDKTLELTEIGQLRINV